MKNKIIRNNIFKVSKIYLMFAIISSIINPVYSQELKEVKVMVECSGGVKTVKIEKYCNKYINGVPFKDSSTPPSIGSAHLHDNICYVEGAGSTLNDVYKHIMSDGSVMYSESVSWTHFDKDVKCEGSFNPMDLLKAMPEIGISRVDPNLIEY